MRTASMVVFNLNGNRFVHPLVWHHPGERSKEECDEATAILVKELSCGVEADPLVVTVTQEGAAVVHVPMTLQHSASGNEVDVLLISGPLFDHCMASYGTGGESVH